MKDTLTSQELREAMDITKVILAEASSKGTLNDFWVVIDCDSENYKDYIHRSNTQGLIDIIAKKHKSLSTRKSLDSVALFKSSDKNKAETEAKRRAKLMKIELVNEDTPIDESGCPACAKGAQNFTALAKKKKSEASVLTGEMRQKQLGAAKQNEYLAANYKCASCKNGTKLKEQAEALMQVLEESKDCSDCKVLRGKHAANIKKRNKNGATLEINLSNVAKCTPCAKSLSENFYASRNAIPAGAELNGGDVNPTMSMTPDRRDRIYQPSRQDVVPAEHKQAVTVPRSLCRLLKSRAADAREYATKLNVTQSQDKQFYNELANAFDDLYSYMDSGTVYDLKMASIYMTTLMGPILYEIPTDVVRFITHGGSHTPLKSFMNSITSPMGGYNVNGELDKL